MVSTDPCFKVLARLNTEQHSRLGMAVSRQVDRRAVGRNRIKRVIRESFRQWEGSRTQHLDVVVLPRRESATISNRRLNRSLKRHWSRLERQLEG
jgi:ribonuclease P protein component